MPSPIAVPKDVVSPWSALSNWLMLVVGGTRMTALLAKATRPMRGPPASDLMKSLAAF